MPDYAALQSEILFRLNRTGDPTITIAAATFAQDRIRHYQNSFFWPGEAQTTTAITLVVGQNNYALPSLPLKYLDIVFVRFLLGSTWIPIQRARDYREILLWDTVSPPVTAPLSRWALLGATFRVYPAPDQVYTLELTVEEKPAAPVAPTDDNFWTEDAFTLIVEAACSDICALFLNDSVRAQNHQTAAEREWRMLVSQTHMLEGPLTFKAWGPGYTNS